MSTTHRFHRLLITASVALLTLSGCGSSLPHERAQAYEDNMNDKDSSEFNVADAATDSNLSTMRGGFLTAGGLLFNFTLSTTTVTTDLNTKIQQSVQRTLSAAGIGQQGVSPQTITQLMTTGTDVPPASNTQTAADVQSPSNTQTALNTQTSSGSGTTPSDNVSSGIQTGTGMQSAANVPNNIPNIPSVATIPNNMAAAATAATVSNNVFTVIQNASNNQLIQNQTVLNLTVSNLAAFRSQQILFAQRFAGGLSR